MRYFWRVPKKSLGGGEAGRWVCSVVRSLPGVGGWLISNPRQCTNASPPAQLQLALHSHNTTLQEHCNNLQSTTMPHLLSWWCSCTATLQVHWSATLQYKYKYTTNTNTLLAKSVRNALSAFLCSAAAVAVYIVQLALPFSSMTMHWCPALQCTASMHNENTHITAAAVKPFVTMHL